MKGFFLAVALLSVTLLSAASVATAQVVVVKTFDPSSAEDRWTAEAFASARPLPLPRIQLRPEKIGRAPVETHDEAAFEEVFASVAEGPTLSRAQRKSFRRVLFDRSYEELRLLRGAVESGPMEGPREAAGKNFGAAGLDYTSSRLIPSTASEAFPYSAVGKLFFSDGTDNFVCSGAVLTRRLVLTAGHCVNDGPNGDFQDFMFAPGYRNGVAPFGVWSVSASFVTNGWRNSGEIPHPEDYALLETVDQGGARISEVSGKIAFLVNSLADNHLHLLGYPGNLDAGEQMHQITSGDFIEFNDGTVIYGSDMGGGSSGGPWIQNFNRKAQGQGGGQNRARVAAVGVASYGFVNESIRAQGSSILTRTFRVLRQQACFHQNGNC